MRRWGSGSTLSTYPVSSALRTPDRSSNHRPCRLRKSLKTWRPRFEEGGREGVRERLSKGEWEGGREREREGGREGGRERGREREQKRREG